MKLSKLISELEIVSINGETDIDINSINHDSRKVIQGSLFIAIKGFKVDGHDYILEAISNGARAIIVDKKIIINSDIKDITIIEVHDTRLALASVASIYYDNPSGKIELIGITGTNAKTTTTYLIKSIFEAVDKKTGIIGTIGNVINDKLVKSENTTPESLELQQALYSMVKEGHSSCAMEVSSHSLELNRVAFCKFNVGVFTNLTTDHLDYHKTFENYFKAKMKLFYMTDKYNIINIDDKHGREMIDQISHINTPLLTYGIEEKADIYADEIEYFADGVRFMLNTPKGSVRIKMNIPGHFSVYNSLAASACAYSYGISLDEIQKGLESVKGVRGRLEIVPTNKDFTVMIDFAHTADALEKVLGIVDQFALGRKVIVFGAGGDRDTSRRAPMGKVAGKYCDLCIVTSDNPRTEDPQAIIDDIVQGVKSVNGNYVEIIDRKEAIRYAIENSKPKDIIILAGKGHETYTILGDKKYPFDEREIVMEILQTLK
ncbi:UDP-N-acetylmuramoyl-L-alanyl-D-glutamate--2,6-diaminopimelate ligase [Brassicibacter mesophilus]|uniref:UDP-N-acetylmuramoyl-L-alanyl-D-glutamate--2, 6-diaminopimelate ligase n=1 Tax=Brassicibacter mesophilus TaxID=745119 RepID=UPI003D1EAC7C